MWKEVKPIDIFQREKEQPIEGASCPNCGERLFKSNIPCPDGRTGCLVIHYGATCHKCNKFFSQ